MKLAMPLILLALTLAVLSPAFAVQPDEMLANPALEQRARTLSRELRCMVCQNQSIDDSDAPLAHDLRVLVRERLKAGDSDRQVLDFLVDRYGQFVLLKPRLDWDTALLWLAPIGILLIGGCGLIAVLRRRDSQSGGSHEPPLTDAERERLQKLLGQSGNAPERSI